MYHRVMNEISLLKNLWLKALSSPGKGEEDEESSAKQQVELSSARVKNGINEICAWKGKLIHGTTN